jgi:hypothetical protein
MRLHHILISLTECSAQRAYPCHTTFRAALGIDVHGVDGVPLGPPMLAQLIDHGLRAAYRWPQ